ncbi:alpha/beta hydrolase family protein [Bacillus andreraoultii]|uniref:hypothetical protein n=1 Tax=Bacillus andreraoultii TaxID=1499685 RepID=UPI00053A0165|nr:hypothetical protein [Bacillus andreraoultii]
MSSFEWFTRMENAIRNNLPELSAKFNAHEIQLKTNSTELHPSFSFYMEDDEIIYEFCVIQFDPVNQELYSYYYNDEYELHSKVLFSELEEITTFVYDAFVEFLSEFDEELENDHAYDWNEEDDYFDEDYSNELPYSDIEVSDENIEWITNDKHIEIEQNWGEHHYSIHLKLGVNIDTSDGLLYRSVLTENEEGEEIQETSFLSFKKEETSYLLDLLNSYVNHIGQEGLL